MAAIVLALAPSIASPSPARATGGWTPPQCSVQPLYNKFAGDGIGSTNIRGARSTIEWFDESLCRQGTQHTYSWSLSWVGILGAGQNIFQGGFAKCANIEAGLSCPYNGGVSYHWWFWEYQDSPACGPYANSGFRKANKGNAGGAAAYDYEIDYRPNVSPPRYTFEIDGVDQTWISTSIPNTCWGGVTGVQYMNEMLDYGDQNGGTVSNHQEHSSTMWQDASRNWHVSNLGSSPCSANSYPAWCSCNIGSGNDTIVSWDRRAP
jgi:hypothetical protein